MRRRIETSMSLTIVLIGWAVSQETPAQADDAAKDLKHALRLLQDASHGLKSLRIQSTIRIYDPRQLDATIQEFAFNETQRGEQWKIERSSLVGRQKELLQLEAFDGQKTYTFVTSTKSASVVEQRRTPQDGWSTIFGTGRDAWGVLGQAADRLKAEWIEDGGRRLEVRWSDADVSHEMRLDPAVDFQPRWWRSLKRTARAGQGEETELQVRRFEEYVPTRQFWFASRGTLRIEARRGDGTKDVREKRFTVTNVEANVEFTDSDFRVEFPQGVKVFSGRTARAEERRPTPREALGERR